LELVYISAKFHLPRDAKEDASIQLQEFRGFSLVLSSGIVLTESFHGVFHAS
jgi:hypothetical protein